jgi:hypothetical protein
MIGMICLWFDGDTIYTISKRSWGKLRKASIRTASAPGWEHLTNINIDRYGYESSPGLLWAQLFNIIYIKFKLWTVTLSLVHFCSKCMPANVTHLFSLLDGNEWDCSLVEFDRSATAAPRRPTGRRYHYMHSYACSTCYYPLSYFSFKWP